MVISFISFTFGIGDRAYVLSLCQIHLLRLNLIKMFALFLTCKTSHDENETYPQHSNNMSSKPITFYNCIAVTKLLIVIGSFMCLFVKRSVYDLTGYRKFKDSIFNLL